MTESRSPRRSFRSFSDLAEFVDFSPTEVLFRVQLLAPKKPKRRLGWVLLAGLSIVVGGLGMDPLVRDWAKTHAKSTVRSVQQLAKSTNLASAARAMMAR